MSEQENVKTVQEMYAAFGRGDVQGVLNHLTDDVVWFTYAPPDKLPWTGEKRGKQEVGGFFSQLSEMIEFSKFNPNEFIAQGNKVVVLGDSEATYKSNGNSNTQEWIMVWTFENGKAKKYQYWDDSYKNVEGLLGPLHGHH